MHQTNKIFTLEACSDDGFSDPIFNSTQPAFLIEAGMKPDTWQKFIMEANRAVEYHWCPDCLLWSLICWIPFFCNQHNKNIRRPMKLFCAKWNSPDMLPAGFHVHYKMSAVKKIVSAPGGYGKAAQLETTHCLIISNE